MKTRLAPLALLAGLLALPAAARGQVDPHRSFDQLVSGNGYSVISYNVPSRRMDAFLEQTFRYWDENVGATQTRPVLEGDGSIPPWPKKNGCSTITPS